MPESLPASIHKVINISNVVPISEYDRMVIRIKAAPRIAERWALTGSGLTPHLGNQCLVVS
jgi:hypothetical protein